MVRNERKLRPFNIQLENFCSTWVWWLYASQCLMCQVVLWWSLFHTQSSLSLLVVGFVCFCIFHKWAVGWCSCENKCCVSNLKSFWLLPSIKTVKCDNEPLFRFLKKKNIWFELLQKLENCILLFDFFLFRCFIRIFSPA